MEANRIKRISGIALLSVMIVIASVSATAGWLLYSQYIDIKRTTRVLDKEQSFLYALALEDTARSILQQEATDRRDQEQLNDFYALNNEQGQFWSRTASLDLALLGASPAFRGVTDINIKIYDLQGFFDINSLRVTTDGCNVKDIPGNMQPRPLIYRVFKKLLDKNIQFDTFGKGTYSSKVFQESLMDWIDQDDNARDDGAEDAQYSLSKIPYHSANSHLSMISELYFVNGFRELPSDQFKKLSRLLTVLPTFAPRPACPKPINLLTAPKELLEMFFQELHPALKDGVSSKVSKLKEALCDPPVDTVDKMKSALGVGLTEDMEEDDKDKVLIKKWIAQVSDRMFGIRSDYFGTHISFKYLGQKVEMSSVFYLRRDTDPDTKRPTILLLHRHQGADLQRDWKLHNGGADAACPVPEEEEEESDIT